MKSENNIKITINSIDWKRKLTSRKFWMAVAGFITTFLVVFGCTDHRQPVLLWLAEL